MFMNYRSYLNALALLLLQILDASGMGKYTGEEVLKALEIFCILLIFVFRYFAGRKIFTKTTTSGGELP